MDPLIMEILGMHKCPLCNSVVRHFFINFNEQILMCENEKCEYPFGHDELQFVKGTVNFNEEVDCMSTLGKRFASVTLLSPEVWSDIEKLKELHEAEDSVFESLDEPKIKDNIIKDDNKIKDDNIIKDDNKIKDDNIIKNDNIIKYDSIIKFNNKIKYDNIIKKKLEECIVNDADIQKNVRDLKGLTKELNSIDQDTDENEIIKNKKWIKKLMSLQGLSGKPLLKKQEMELLKHERPICGGGELKIDIETNKNNMSSINIQIIHKDDGKTELVT